MRRPDVISADQIPAGTQPIAANPKKKAMKKSLLSSRFALPASWDPSAAAIDGWWISEMYSGVRALWDAQSNTLYLRNGMTIKAPKIFGELLSHHATITQLDGVLWLGYGKQQDLAQLMSMNSQDKDLWGNMKYLIFDIPNSPHRLEDRFDLLKALHLPADSPLKVIEQVVCNGTEHLMEMLSEIETKGGEGVILRLPKSLYSERMAYSMLKVQQPKGKARLKFTKVTAVTCELASGIVFDIPISPVELEMLRQEHGNDIIVSFKQDAANTAFDEPINPSFQSIRRDLSWENVLEESTPYYLAQTNLRGKRICAGCKQRIKKQQYCVHLQSLYTPVGKKPHTVLYQFCSKSECINKAVATNWSGKKLIPKLEAVYVPQSLLLLEEKLQTCVGLKLLSSRDL